MPIDRHPGPVLVTVVLALAGCTVSPVQQVGNETFGVYVRGDSAAAAGELAAAEAGQWCARHGGAVRELGRENAGGARVEGPSAHEVRLIFQCGDASAPAPDAALAMERLRASEHDRDALNARLDAWDADTYE